MSTRAVSTCRIPSTPRNTGLLVRKRRRRAIGIRVVHAEKLWVYRAFTCQPVGSELCVCCIHGPRRHTRRCTAEHADRAAWGHTCRHRLCRTASGHTVVMISVSNRTLCCTLFNARQKCQIVFAAFRAPSRYRCKGAQRPVHRVCPKGLATAIHHQLRVSYCAAPCFQRLFSPVFTVEDRSLLFPAVFCRLYRSLRSLTASFRTKLGSENGTRGARGHVPAKMTSWYLLTPIP